MKKNIRLFPICCVALLNLYFVYPALVMADDHNDMVLKAQDKTIKTSEESVDTQEQEMEIKEEVINYQKILSFPIDREKLISFVTLADKINRVNRKWDMLISGAETESLTLEYITLLNEEMTQVLNNAPMITLAEYNEIFALTTRDEEFKTIVDAFHDYHVVRPRLEAEIVINQDESSAISEN